MFCIDLATKIFLEGMRSLAAVILSKTKAVSDSKSCKLEEYVNGDDTVPMCIDINNESWEEEFFDK